MLKNFSERNMQPISCIFRFKCLYLQQNCIFDKNVSVYSKDNNYGGPACLLERSTVNFTDCKFINNESIGRGGAIKLTSDGATKGYTTLNRCLVSGNKASSLGSAIFFNHGQELNIINSIVAENN